jgi:hypothetical protein
MTANRTAILSANRSAILSAWIACFLVALTWKILHRWDIKLQVN